MCLKDCNIRLSKHPALEKKKIKNLKNNNNNNEVIALGKDYYCVHIYLKERSVQAISQVFS